MAIPNQTITHHHVGEIKAEFAAGIRAEDFPHIANLLINLYSDPVQAVIREYCTNALDAHIAAGNTDPILVTLPTQSSPEFVVQDFGIGLSIDDLRDVYSMYGRSLKRESNDMVGQLGLGCKSGLTYADAFTITAIKDGVKCVAMSTKDERGVGTIRVIDTVATDEPNGVRIAIPVRSYDIHTFASTARNLFQFWDEGTVLVDGVAPEVPEWRKQALALDDDTWVIPMNAGLYSSYVVMGNVAYEVPDAKFGPAHRRQQHRFVARVNMGDVDFVPSREAVHHTAWTTETLADLSTYIGEHFDRVLNERLAKCATRWDETQLKVHWKGSSMRVNASQAMPIWSYDPSRWQRKARAHTAYAFSDLTESSVVVITNFPNKSLSTVHRDRLGELVTNANYYIVIPQGCDVSGFGGRANTYTWDEVLAATGGPSAGKGKAARIKRDETKYSTMGGPAYTAAELVALGTKVLYLLPQESCSSGDLGCTVVRLYSSNQVNRLERLVPGIRYYWNELADRRKVVEEAITAYDRRLVSAKRLGGVWTRLDPAMINDSDLAEAIRMSRQATTDTLEDARKMGITVSGTGDDVNKTFIQRYPMLDPNKNYYAHRMPVEDIYLYINAKFPSVAAAAASDTMDFELPEDVLDTVAS